MNHDPATDRLRVAADASRRQPLKRTNWGASVVFQRLRCFGGLFLIFVTAIGASWANDQSAGKGRVCDAIVRTPDGSPANNAKVVIASNKSTVSLKNGQLAPGVIGDAVVCETDKTGRFQFQPRAASYYFLITHPTGYAIYRPAAANRRIINLDPWTRVEGTCCYEDKPFADMPIILKRLGRLAVDGDAPVDIRVVEDTKTDSQGRFVIDRVFSGKAWIVEGWAGSMENSRRQTSQCSILSILPVGKTVHIDFGRSGRPLVGKLRRPAGSTEAPPWLVASVSLRNKTQNARVVRRALIASVDRDGAFRFDDVPPGDYTLDVRFTNRFIDWHLSNYEFAVSNIDDGHQRRPQDLGSLTLKSE
jgi:hypothetical protein